MERNGLAEVGQRLGWFAYMTVMGGGRPFWPALFDGPRAVGELIPTPERLGGDAADRNPFANTVPYEYGRDHQSTTAA